MRNHRFYSPLPIEAKQHITLSKEVSHHCINVLRYKKGDTLTLFDGDGHDYLGKIVAIENKLCTVAINNKTRPENESPLKIHLTQGIARGEKMDLIIQKAVELGVHKFTPLFSERCNVKLDKKRLSKKLEHWQAVATSACEQSGRATIPTINTPVNIQSFKLEENTNAFFLEPTAQEKIHDIKIRNCNQITLFIGPEGGFSRQEQQLLSKQSVKGIQLGPRILRTETAGLACIAILQALFGDL